MEGVDRDGCRVERKARPREVTQSKRPRQQLRQRGFVLPALQAALKHE